MLFSRVCVISVQQMAPQSNMGSESVSASNVTNEIFM